MRIIPVDPNRPLIMDSDFCPGCGERMLRTGCSAARCLGLWCGDCEVGCDIDTRPDSGECAQAIEATWNKGTGQ